MPIIPRLSSTAPISDAPGVVLDRQQRPTLDTSAVQQALGNFMEAGKNAPINADAFTAPYEAISSIGRAISETGSVIGALAKKQQDATVDHQVSEADTRMNQVATDFETWRAEHRHAPEEWQPEFQRRIGSLREEFSANKKLINRSRHAIDQRLGQWEAQSLQAVSLEATKQTFSLAKSSALTSADTARQAGKFGQSRQIISDAVQKAYIYPAEAAIKYQEIEHDQIQLAKLEADSHLASGRLADAQAAITSSPMSEKEKQQQLTQLDLRHAQNQELHTLRNQMRTHPERAATRAAELAKAGQLSMQKSAEFQIEAEMYRASILQEGVQDYSTRIQLGEFIQPEEVQGDYRLDDPMRHLIIDRALGKVNSSWDYMQSLAALAQAGPGSGQMPEDSRRTLSRAEQEATMKFTGPLLEIFVTEVRKRRDGPVDPQTDILDAMAKLVTLTEEGALEGINGPVMRPKFIAYSTPGTEEDPKVREKNGRFLWKIRDRLQALVDRPDGPRGPDAILATAYRLMLQEGASLPGTVSTSASAPTKSVAEFQAFLTDQDAPEGKKKSPTIPEDIALFARTSYDSLPERLKQPAQQLLQAYAAQQSAAGQPDFPQERQRQRQAAHQAVLDPQTVDQTNGLYAQLGKVQPAQAALLRQQEASVQFLAHELQMDPQRVRSDFTRYATHYAAQKNWEEKLVTDPAAFHAKAKEVVTAQQAAQKKRKDAAWAGFESAIKGGGRLQEGAHFQHQHPDATPEEMAAFQQAYGQASAVLAPHREALRAAAPAMRRVQRGEGTPADAELIEKLTWDLAATPDKEKDVLMRALMLDARRVAEEGGRRDAAGTFTGTAVQLIESMFGSRRRGEAMARSIDPALPQPAVRPITSVEDALQFIDTMARADISARLPYDPDPPEIRLPRQFSIVEGKKVYLDQDQATPTRLLTAEEQTFVIEAKRRVKELFKTERQLRKIAQSTDPMGEMFSEAWSRDASWGDLARGALNSAASGTASTLTLVPVMAMGPQGMLLAGGGYANMEYEDLLTEFPDMDPEDAARISLFSAALQTALDKATLYGLDKFAPNVRKILTGGITRQLVKRTVLQGGTHVAFENTVEGLQDLSTPIVQDIMSEFSTTVPGVDWEKENRDFWRGRADVAIGMGPMMILSSIGMTAANRADINQLLKDNEALMRAGIVEADRASILTHASAGNTEQAFSAFKEAMSRRSPELAAEMADAEINRQTDARSTVQHGEHQGILPQIRRDGGSHTVTDAQGNTARFATWEEARAAAQQHLQEKIAVGQVNPQQLQALGLQPDGTPIAPATTSPPNQIPGNDEATTAASTSSTTPRTDASGRLQFSQGRTPADEAVSVHRRLAESDTAFQLGKDKPATQGDLQKGDWFAAVKDLVTAFSTTDSPLKMGDRYPGHPDGYAFEVETNNGSAMIVIDRADKAIRINSAGLNSNDSVSGGGSQVYQMAATFARNNGLTFLPDRTVEPVAQRRRISHIITSILRHGTSRHFDGRATFEDARTGETKTEVPGWKPGEDDHNLALLLKMEYDYVMEEARAQGIDLSHLTHDPVTDNIIDATTSSPLTSGALEHLVERFQSRAGGVGQTTLLRALVTGSALQRGSSDGSVHHLHENATSHPGSYGDGRSDGELVSVAQRLYYSRAPADAHSASPRAVGQSLSGRPGGAAAPLAEAARYVNGKLPGLIHDRTQLFTSLEELLASDYARQHPFSPEQQSALQSAEGFFDKSSGRSVIIAGNIVPRAGESATSAVTRVILHERVGHDGLDLLLGGGVHQKRWQTLLGQIPDSDLQAIAQEKGYEDIAGNKNALGLEWFARQVEKDPGLLERQPLLKELWETLKRALTDFMAGISPDLDALKGADLETNLRELITRARHAALNKTGDRVSKSSTAHPVVPKLSFSVQMTDGSTLRAMLPERELPASPLENPTPQSSFQWWEENMVGQTIHTPIGLNFEPKPGHFFRFVAGGTQDGIRKGQIEGYETAADAMTAIRNGEIAVQQINGWQDFRAGHLPIVKDLLEDPDFVLLERQDGKNALKFIKRFRGTWGVIGFGTTQGQFAPLSFSPRKMKPGEWSNARLLYASPKLEGMQNTLPALPSNHSGIWQGQDPERWVNDYPLIQGEVNLGDP